MGGKSKGSALHHRRSDLRHLDGFAAAILLSRGHLPANWPRSTSTRPSLAPIIEVHIIDSQEEPGGGGGFSRRLDGYDSGPDRRVLDFPHHVGGRKCGAGSLIPCERYRRVRHRHKDPGHEDRDGHLGRVSAERNINLIRKPRRMTVAPPQESVKILVEIFYGRKIQAPPEFTLSRPAASATKISGDTVNRIDNPIPQAAQHRLGFADRETAVLQVDQHSSHESTVRLGQLVERR
jgi:hypothetical protein